MMFLCDKGVNSDWFKGGFATMKRHSTSPTTSDVSLMKHM